MVKLITFLLIASTAASQDLVLDGFDTESSARAKSAALMSSLQTEATRNDTNTVTRFLFAWRKARGREEWALMVSTNDVRHLPLVDKDKLKTKTQEWEDDPDKTPKD